VRSLLEGLGTALPERVVTGAGLGALPRPAAAPGELGHHLGARAARAALSDAGIAPADVDLLVYHTTFADYSIPGSGVLVQKALGLRAGIPVFDLRQQCAGFLYAWMAADAYVVAGTARSALLVCGERLVSNCVVHPPAAPIFGDAGAAAVITATADDRGLLDVRAFADGTGAEFGLVSSDHYDVLDPSREVPAEMARAVDDWRRAPLARRVAWRWDARVLDEEAVSRMAQATRQMLDAHRLEPGDVDWYVLQQAGPATAERVSQVLKLPAGRVLTGLESHGNTSSASIPLQLAGARRRGQLRPGQLVLLCAFGAGYTWATALYRA
jgi:3-oxoacyl-[acyl-carrier-protein] synthase-3